MPSKKKQKKYRILKILLKFLAGFLLFFALIILFIRSPWGQNIIINKVVSFVSDKTGTRVEVERVFVTFSGNVYIEDLYLEDLKGDTLVFSEDLEASIELLPIIQGKKVNLKSLDWSGLTANINREKDSTNYNYNFLISAFETPDTTTTSAPMEIEIGVLDFSNFNIRFNDALIGIQSSMQLGKLYVNVDEFDLTTMNFHIDEARLKNSLISYNQTESFLVDQDALSNNSILPTFIVDELGLENVEANYYSETEKIVANTKIGDLKLQLPELNLKDQIINVDKFELKNSDVKFVSTKSRVEAKTDSNSVKQIDFEWPVWKINASQMSLANNHIFYQNGKILPSAGEFNPNAIELFGLSLESDTFKMANGHAEMNLQKISFKEISEFNLENLSFNLNVNNVSLSLSNFQLTTNQSSIKGSIQLDYHSIKQLFNSPELTLVNLNFPKFNVSLKELFLFQPSLVDNYYFSTLSEKMIEGNLKASGTLAEIKIPNTSLQWGASTTINLNGVVSNVTDVDFLRFNMNQFTVTSNDKDIKKFISDEELSFSIPKKVVFTGSVKGSLNDINADVKLMTSQGKIEVDGNFSNSQGILFNGVINANSIELGKVLNNEKIGPISFKANVYGKGSDINSLDATLETDFSSLTYNNYDFSNLTIKGNMKDGVGGADLKFKDDNLNLDGRVDIVLDSVAPEFHLVMDVIGADFYGLKLTKEDIRAAFKIETNFKGNESSFDLNSHITNGVTVYDGDTYSISDFDMKSRVRSDSTYANISSRLIDANLVSNSNPQDLAAALKNQFKEYFSDKIVVDSIRKPVKMELDMIIRKTPDLEDVYMKSLKKLDTVKFKLNFDENKNELTANLTAPFIQYDKIILDSLEVNIDSNKEMLNFDFGWSGVKANPLFIKKTSFDGTVKDKTVFLNFNAFDEDEQLVYIQSEINFKNDTIQAHINPSELVLNKLPWDISPNNELIIASEYAEFNNFSLTRNLQKLSVNTMNTNSKTDRLEINFDNFKLATFLSFLNSDEQLVNGDIKGDFLVEAPFNNSGIVANATIDNFKAFGEPLGTLTLDATSQNSGIYDFDLSIKGNADLNLTGNYRANEPAANLNLDLKINEIKLKTIEGFTQEIISNTEGNLSGNVKIAGTTADPQYNGDIKFNQAALVINRLNSKYMLSEENIRVDNKGVYFDTFTIADKDDNTFELTGKILTKEITNPSFDLAIKAENFQVINSTNEDNDLFYGKVKVNTDITVKGDLEVPIIRGNFYVNKDSDFTIVIPESQVDVVEREGVVIFVNRENSDAILTRKEESESAAILKGYDVETSLHVRDDAIVKIILDERTGDNIKISGSGNFDLALEPNGRISLSGRYEVSDGHYEANLYNLIKRRFDVAPGGTITWNGDPFDADLNVRAIYKVETSAAPLMLTQTSNQSSALAGKFRQELPFLVYLNVNGALLQPEISFNLDIPEDKQGSLGGEVYARVQQLNDREEELNKQVFSLLVLNRFFPGSTSDGSAGGATSIARDNVNKVLSSQLNSLSNKIVGNTGVNLNFGLDSYTDYQGDTPQNRTQLGISASKNLFNDRLIVKVGSEVDIEGSSTSSDETTPIIGNLSLEYLLTENGRIRLKGFRQNEFESVIDGQLIVTGISLIYNREFNKFRELFEKMVKEEKQKNK